MCVLGGGVRGRERGGREREILFNRYIKRAGDYNKIRGIIVWAAHPAYDN